MSDLTTPGAAIRARVSRMARVGMPEYQIAFSIAVSLKILRAFYAHELLESAIELNLQVLETFAFLATSGKNPAATIAWAKMRCGAHPPPDKRPGREPGPTEKYGSIIFEGPDGQFQEVKLP